MTRLARFSSGRVSPNLLVCSLLVTLTPAALSTVLSSFLLEIFIPILRFIFFSSRPDCNGLPLICLTFVLSIVHSYWGFALLVEWRRRLRYSSFNKPPWIPCPDTAAQTE